MTSATATTVVISWIAHHGRSEAVAQHLNAQTVWMPWARPGQPLLRTLGGWLRSSWRTWVTVRRLGSGSVVVVMCPPVFALMVARAAARRVSLVADVHSGAVNSGRWAWSVPLLARYLRNCAVILVTNRRLLAQLDTGASPVLVLHDPPPTTAPPVAAQLPGLPAVPLIVFPASGAPDEPLGAVLEAAALLAGTATIVVTGKAHGLRPQPGLHLTGFLPEEQYQALLRRASVILALTERENTMQRAGYEAVQVGVPLVCSDRKVLREFFAGAAVYTDHTPEGIAEAVRSALERGPLLRAATAICRHRQSANLGVLQEYVRQLRAGERL